jgi:hypothetical protein
MVSTSPLASVPALSLESRSLESGARGFVRVLSRCSLVLYRLRGFRSLRSLPAMRPPAHATTAKTQRTCTTMLLEEAAASATLNRALVSMLPDHANLVDHSGRRNRRDPDRSTSRSVAYISANAFRPETACDPSICRYSGGAFGAGVGCCPSFVNLLAVVKHLAR